MERRFFMLGIGLLWLCGTTGASEPARVAGLDKGQMVFPGKDWAIASPQSQQFDPGKFKAAVEYLEHSLSEYGGAGTVFIVRRGQVIWAGPHSDQPHQIYSATKSFTSTVLGLLIDDGKVTLDTLAKDLEPALANQYPTVTLRHFATMTSGYDAVGGSYEFDSQGRGDSWNPGPPAPPIFAPGTQFRYWDDAMMQFGSLLTKAAGEPLDRLFKTRIADALGMTQWQWTENDSATGRVLSWTGGIHTSSQDLARFGHLVLNRGNWNGRQLVSASWIAQATAVQVPATVPNDDLPRSRGSGVYGYNWWVNGVKPDGKRLWPAAPPSTFYANGLHNNVCIVVPEWNMVIARTNGGREDGSANTPANVDEIWSGFFGRLAEAMMPQQEPHAARAVHLKDRSLWDDNGPFLGLGVSYFQALRHAKYDRERLKSNLALFASKGFNYVRILSMVSWEGLEIAPVTFTNHTGREVPAWPDYWEQFRSLLDLAAQHGLRVEVTIFADAQFVMPTQATRQTHVDGILANIAGREQHVLHLEVANEAWQNGFPAAQGIAELRAFTQHLADRTSVPVAITSNADTSDQGIIALYRGSAADLATVHFSRDTSTVEGGWLPVRDAYRAGNLAGVPPVSSNEPIGPGSSVSSESDPIKLCAAAVFAYVSNLPTYVYHSRAGVDQIQWALGKDDTLPTEFKLISPGKDGQVVATYADGTQVSFELPTTGPMGGAIFIGERGKLEINRNKFTSNPPDIRKELLKKVNESEEDVKWSDQTALWQARWHMQNWLDSIKTRERPNAEIEIGHRSIAFCHLANTTRYVGRAGEPLRFDPTSERFIDNDEANSWNDRPRRAGYELPAV